MADMNEMWGAAQVHAEVAPEKAELFRNLKYGMFIHWGLFSEIAAEWRGKKFYGIPEWIMFAKKIPAAQYEKTAAKFNPEKFDAEALADFAVQCGFRYIVITAKHHEGFAMFRSKHPYNIVTGSPYGKDPMLALSKACEKRGLGFGFYYSQFQDWHEINRWEKRKCCSFDTYFRTKCLPQIQELLTQYGKLTLIWFDTPGEMTSEQSEEIVKLVHKHQPQALVNSRIGNGAGEYSTQGDQEIPLLRLPGLWESCDTTNDSWGYSSNDMNFIKPQEIVWRLIRNAARGGNYLLNVGPDGSGVIPELCRNALLCAGTWIRRFGAETLYGAEASPWPVLQPWGDCTRRGNKAYFFLQNAVPGAVVTVLRFPGKVRSVKRLSDNAAVDFTQKGELLELHLPMLAMDSTAEPLVLECTKNIPECPADSPTGVDPLLPTQLPAESAGLAGSAKFAHLQWMERFGEWKHRTCIHQWDKSSAASWKIYLREKMNCRISVEYQGVPEKARVWRISCAGKSVDMWARSAAGHTKDEARFERFRAGVLELPAGESVLKIAPVPPCGNPASMQIAALVLEPFR